MISTVLVRGYRSVTSEAKDGDKIVRNLITGTWAVIDEHCTVRCGVDGSGVARVLIGEDDQGIELIFGAEGFRRLAESSTKAVAEMDSLFE